MKKIIAAAGLALAGLSFAHAEEMKSETRQVSPFTGVEMRGAAKVFVTVGSQQSVVIEADANVIDEITTEVREKTLVIDRKDHWPRWTDGHVIVRISVPKLAAFALAGAGDLAVTGLNGGSTAFSISGAGNMKGSGALQQLNVVVSGAGNVDFGQVQTDSAAVVVNGTGSVSVHPRHSLNAVVNGVGSITYDGSPEQLVTAVNGVGSVKQRAKE